MQCWAEIIYFRLRLLLGSTFVLNLGSGSSSSPVLLLYKMKIFVFQEHKNYLFYKSNIMSDGEKLVCIHILASSKLATVK